MLKFKEIEPGNGERKEFVMSSPGLQPRWFTQCGHIIRSEDYAGPVAEQYLNCATGKCK